MWPGDRPSDLSDLRPQLKGMRGIVVTLQHLTSQDLDSEGKSKSRFSFPSALCSAAVLSPASSSLSDERPYGHCCRSAGVVRRVRHDLGCPFTLHRLSQCRRRRKEEGADNCGRSLGARRDVDVEEALGTPLRPAEGDVGFEVVAEVERGFGTRVVDVEGDLGAWRSHWWRRRRQRLGQAEHDGVRTRGKQRGSMSRPSAEFSSVCSDQTWKKGRGTTPSTDSCGRRTPGLGCQTERWR